MYQIWKPLVLLFLAPMLLPLSGCEGEPAANPVTGLEARYKELTSGQGTREDIDAARKELIAAYLGFVEEHPEDSLAVVYLDQAATFHASEPSESRDAIALFDRLISEYPESGRAADALFMKAYIQSNILQDYDAAKSTFEAFLEKYPEHGLASDARNELEIMGIPIEQIFDSLPKDSVEAE